MPLLPPSGIGDFKVSITSYTVAAIGSTLVAKNSPNRISITISCSSGGVFIGIGSASLNNGVNLSSGTPVWSAKWNDDGALVNQEFWAAGSAQQVTVIEVFYQPAQSPIERLVPHGDAKQTNVSGVNAHGKSQR